jgi:hypothetical protein
VLRNGRVIGEAAMFTTSADLQNAGMIVSNYSNWTDVFMVTGIQFALRLQ